MLASLRSLKIGLKPLSENQPNVKTKGNLIPKIAGEGKKIKGDKLPKSHWMAEAHQFLIE